MINHGYGEAANVEFRDEQDGTVAVYPLRQIEKGEELRVDYGPGYDYRGNTFLRGVPIDGEQGWDGNERGRLTDLGSGKYQFQTRSKSCVLDHAHAEELYNVDQSRDVD